MKEKKLYTNKTLGLLLVIVSISLCVIFVYAYSQLKIRDSYIKTLEKSLKDKESQLVFTQEKAHDLELMVQKFQRDIGAMEEQAAKDQEIIRALGEKVGGYIAAIKKISIKWIRFEGNFCNDDIVPKTKRWMRKMSGK